MRFAIREDLSGIVVDLDQVVRDSMRAIDVVDQVREFFVSNRVLVIFEDVPFWLAPENADVVSGETCDWNHQAQQKK